MVYGGEKKSRSITSVNDGTAWKDRSVWNGRGAAQSGRTSFSSIWMQCQCPAPLGRCSLMLTARRLQYKRLIKHSMGALATLRAFLTWNSVEFIVTSASRPTVKVAVARDRPMMVRYCMCQP